MAKTVGVVVTYQSAGILADCLTSLDGETDDVIVVDNASTDATCEVAERRGVRVLRNTDNVGYGVANNRGIEVAAGADWCLVVNPDVRLEKGCVAALLKAAQAMPNAAILVPRLIELDGRVFFRHDSILAVVPPVMPTRAEPPSDTALIAFASGACMLVHRDRFRRIGGFDSKIFLFYEDDDLSLRIRQAGFEIVHVHDAVAHHLRGSSSASALRATHRSRYHQAWSRSYIARKYGLKDDGAAIILRNGLKLIWALVTRNQGRAERYSGSIAGAWAALRGRPSLFVGKLE